MDHIGSLFIVCVVVVVVCRLYLLVSANLTPNQLAYKSERAGDWMSETLFQIGHETRTRTTTTSKASLLFCHKNRASCVFDSLTLALLGLLLLLVPLLLLLLLLLDRSFWIDKKSMTQQQQQSHREFLMKIAWKREECFNLKRLAKQIAEWRAQDDCSSSNWLTNWLTAVYMMADGGPTTTTTSVR